MDIPHLEPDPTNPFSTPQNLDSKESSKGGRNYSNEKPNSNTQKKIERIVYHKKQVRKDGTIKSGTPTKHWGISGKDLIGEGGSTEVYILKEDPQRVVKKTLEKIDRIEKEFKIGNEIDHPNFVKTHSLYTKLYPEDLENLDEHLYHKLVMDKLDGELLEDKNLSSSELLELIFQTKNYALYLFDKNIYWADLHRRNLAISNSDGKLILFDFGLWEMEEDYCDKTFCLLAGSMEIVKNLINCSVLNKLDKQQIRSLIIPDSFKEGVKNWEYITTPLRKTGREKLNDLKNKINGLSEEQAKNFLSSYFEEVIDTLKKTLLS